MQHRLVVESWCPLGMNKTATSARVPNKTEQLFVSELKGIIKPLCKKLWEPHPFCVQWMQSTGSLSQSNHNDRIMKLTEACLPARLPHTLKIFNCRLNPAFAAGQANGLCYLLCVLWLYCSIRDIQSCNRAEWEWEDNKALCAWDVDSAGTVLPVYQGSGSTSATEQTTAISTEMIWLCDSQPDDPDSSI